MSEQEIPFTPAENQAIDATLAARAELCSTWAHIITAAKAHSIPLRRGRKKPENSGWPKAPSMNEATLAAHLLGGGNVGALLGASGECGWIAWDLDNELAAQALADAGYAFDTVPANSLNPNHSKGRFGGRHKIWAVPEEWGLHGMQLTVPGGTITLTNGGTVDVLTGAKFLVLPPTVICEEGVVNPYNRSESGWLPNGAAEPLPVCFWPDRFRPADAPEPPVGLEAMRVQIRDKTVYEAAEERCLSADSHELTDKVDSVQWSEWLALDPRSQITVLDAIDSCGCNKLHFADQSSDDGGVLHHGCSYGNGVHVHSGSLKAALSANGEDRDHMSRLDFMAGLLGREKRDIAREVGIELRGSSQHQELGAITAADFEAWADAQDAAGNPGVAAAMRAQAQEVRERVHSWMEQQGEVFLDPAVRVFGAPTQPPIVPPTPAADAVRPDLHVIQGGLSGPPPITGIGSPAPKNATPEAMQIPTPQAATPPATEPIPAVAPEPAPSTDDQIQSLKLKARAQLLHASEPELLDRIFCTPIMTELRNNARLSLVSPLVKLMADLTAILSLIPPTVTLPPIVMDSEAGLNFIHNVVGRSGAGKGTCTRCTFKAYGASRVGGIGPVEEHPPVPRTPGSGEVIASVFARVENNEDGSKESVIHTESARLYWPEITKLTAVRARSGSTLAAELCQVWSSENLGSDTKTETAFCDEHTYRATTTIASQLATAGAMYDPASVLMGLGQRVWNISAELTEAPQEGTPEWEELARANPTITLRDLFLPQFRPGPVPVDERVHYEVRVLRMRAATEEETPELALETHTALMRVKLAVAASVYHGGPVAVTWEWWCWTEHLLEHHRRVRTACQTAVGIARHGETVEAGVRDALRKQARETSEHAAALQRTLAWARKRYAAGNPLFTVSQQGRAGGFKTYRELNSERICTDLLEAGLLGVQVIQNATGPSATYYGVTEAGLVRDVDQVA